MKKACALILFFLITVASAQSQWKWVGPPLGDITKLEPAPDNSQVWFAISDHKLYRSHNGGSSWAVTSLDGVMDVAVQPNTSFVFAVQETIEFNYVWRSTDSGRSFEVFSVGLRWTNGPIQGPIIRFNPANPDQIYIIEGTLNLVRAHRPWAPFLDPIDISKPYRGCYVDVFLFYDVFSPPFQPGTLYASAGPRYDCGWDDNGNEDSSFMVSRNGGRSWQVLKPAGKYELPYRFYYDSRSPDVAYVTGPHSTSRITAHGIEDVSARSFSTLAVVPHQPLELYALKFLDADKNPVDLFHSIDGGRSWTTFKNDMLNGIDLLAVRNERSLFGELHPSFYAWGGLYIYENGKWVASNSGFRESLMTFTHTVPGSSLVYAGNSVLYVSTDRGRSWVDRTMNLPFSLSYSTRATNFVGHPSNEKLLYLCGPNLYRTEDAGQTWSVIASGYWRIVGFDPQDPEIVYLTKGYGAVYRSIKGGASPRMLPIHFDTSSVTKIVVSPKNPQILFLLDGQYNLMRSTDGGKTVQRVTSRFYYDILARPEAHQYLALVPRNGIINDVYLSNDEGNTWSLIGHTQAEQLLNAGPPGSTEVWGFQHDRGIFQSFDGGKNWSKLPQQIGAGIFQITNPGKFPVYAATDKGVFVLNGN